jgi:hypothetical protein
LPPPLPSEEGGGRGLDYDPEKNWSGSGSGLRGERIVVVGLFYTIAASLITFSYFSSSLPLFGLDPFLLSLSLSFFLSLPLSGKSEREKGSIFSFQHVVLDPLSLLHDWSVVRLRKGP